MTEGPNSGAAPHQPFYDSLLKEKTMTQQKPTVGRQVHYYATETRWSQNVGEIGLDAAERERAKAFRGPYAATVVFVHEDGSVNLNVLFPAKAYGTDRVSEIVEKVRLVGFTGVVSNYWDWPPRV